MPTPSDLTQIVLRINDMGDCKMEYTDVVYANSASRTDTYKIRPFNFTLSNSKRSVIYFTTNYVKGRLTLEPPSKKRPYWRVTSQYYMKGKKYGVAKTDELVRDDTVTIHCDRE